jgi:hypothetical protein
MLPDAALEAKITYPRFLNAGEGDLFFVYRVGVSGHGDHYLHRYDTTNGVWTRLGKLFSSLGAYAPWQDSKSRCAYLHDVLFDSRNRLHVSWVFRETGASWASNHDLHYAYSDDRGLTWRNNVGEAVADLSRGDPIELADEGIVVKPVPVYSWLMNQGCMALDSTGRPHVVTYKSRVVHRPEKLQHGPPERLRKELCFVHFWRTDEGTWRGGRPIAAGPLGVSRVDVVFDPNDNLSFFYPTEQGFRYVASRASDQWGAWSGARPLTGPEITGRDASKHDRRRWLDEGILSFTAKLKPDAFVILDLAPNRP